jgi:HTH-type transcriptional regulator / antitoxin HipB
MDSDVLSSFVDTSIMSTNEDSAGRRIVPDIVIADWNKFGATIKAERARLMLSQHDLASRAGVSRSWLARLEAGHRGAEFEQILRVLEALGLSLVLHSDAPSADEAGARPTPAHHSSPDAKAMQELMDKHQRSAEIRRRAWSAGGPRPTPPDHD